MFRGIARVRSKGPYLIVSWIHLNAARRERSIVDRPWVATAAPDPNREYLALLSYLPLKSYRKTFDLFRRAQAVATQLANTPGLIGSPSAPRSSATDSGPCPCARMNVP